MEEKIFNFLRETFLFRNIRYENALSALKESDIEIRKYLPKEHIFTPESYEKKLGFIFSGECVVERMKSDGSAFPLNLLKAGDSFGIIAVFSNEDEFPTGVIAKKASEIIFISKSSLEKIIKNCPEIAINIIVFLSDKVNFLNQKITTFSSDSVEEKLANFLISEYKKHSSTELFFNAKKTSETINAGRASLYRALSALTSSGVITHDNKKIIINDLEGLERITK